MRLIFLFIFGFTPLLLPAQAGIALTSVEGKPAILHQVKKGETLYAISKKYNTTVDQIKIENPALQQNELPVNTNVAIFYNPKLLVDVNQVNKNMCTPLLHKVEKGETLFGLAKRNYEVEIADLKQWNKLNDNTISIGQALIVGWIYADPANHQQVTAINQSISTAKSNSIEKDRAFNIKSAEESSGRIVYVSKGIESSELTDLKGSKPVYTSPKNPFIDKKKVEDEKLGNEVSVTTSPSKTEETPGATNEVEESKAVLSAAPAMLNDKRLARDIFTEMETDVSGKYTLKKERGAAKWFKPENNSVQLFALHKNAPVGSVLKVSNPINNYTVYVKVMGALPENDENQNALLKISSNAMELLKVYDKVFLVDVSFYDVK